MKAKAYFVEGKDTPVIASWESQHGHDQVAVQKKIVIFRLKTTFDEVKSRGGEHHKYLQNVNCISLV